MRFDIMTLFPELVETVLSESIIGRARKAGILEINTYNIRDYSKDKHRRVDDTPYGGGRGMLMSPVPIYDCFLAATDPEKNPAKRRRVLYMSPQGRVLTQEKARTLAAEYDNIVILCGHYEGVDERIIEEIVDEEISIGDFVLTGGEIPAMAVADAVCRMVPGVLPDEEAFTAESHWDGLLEHPQYTRPENWRGREVPEVLLSGHHANIEAWRREMSLRRTKKDRPDLFAKFEPQDKRDRKILEKIRQDG